MVRSHVSLFLPSSWKSIYIIDIFRLQTPLHGGQALEPGQPHPGLYGAGIQMEVPTSVPGLGGQNGHCVAEWIESPIPV